MSSATLTPSLRRRPAGAAPVRARTAAPVRLTRRGRFLVFVALFMVVLGVVIAGAASVSASTSSSTPSAARPATRTVVVQPGQTLWQVAVRVAPHRDPRDVIRQISELNALTGVLVSPGQSLAVPIP